MEGKSIAIIGRLYFELPRGVLGYSKQSKAEFIKYDIYDKLPRTWLRNFKKLEKEIQENKILGVLIYLTTPLFLQASQTIYTEAWEYLLRIASQTKSLIVAFEENINENFSCYDYQEERTLSREEIMFFFEEKNKELELSKQKRGALMLKYPEVNFGEPSEYLNKLYEQADVPFDLPEPIQLKVSEIREYTYLENKERTIQKKLDEYKFGLDRLAEYEARQEEVALFIDKLLDSGVELTTFKTKKDLEVRLESFVYDVINDIIFSIYVSKAQPLFEEFEQFVNVFKSYLQKVEGISLVVETDSSANGTTFNFKAKSLDITSDNFSQAVSRFDDFMSLCLHSPDDALNQLQAQYPDPLQAFGVVQELSKKYKRVLMDVKHQQQKLELEFKHEFESILLDKGIASNYQQIIPSYETTLDIFSTKNNYYQLSLNKRLSADDLRIIDITSKFGQAEDKNVVQENIEKINDSGLPKEERQVAYDKIKSSLLKAGRTALKHAEDIGVKVLLKYLESKID